MKLKSLKAGFTLVEIMIVVAIIALLASIAVPNFMRARLRSQAGLVKDDLRVLDSAMDQWAIERNKKTDDAVTFADIKGYIKEGSPLYTGKDILGGSYVISKVGTLPAMAAATATSLSSVTDAEYWSPFSKDGL
jgi:prepilin-type N-terminal cleavage/methylation domain-containing protein